MLVSATSTDLRVSGAFPATTEATRHNVHNCYAPKRILVCLLLVAHLAPRQRLNRSPAALDPEGFKYVDLHTNWSFARMAERQLGATSDSPTFPRDLIVPVLRLLHPNERALAGRLVCKDAWRGLSEPEHCSARFSLPLPAHALDSAWRPHLQQALKHLTFRYRFLVLPAAASSGSEVNLELAWGLLRPGLFLELVRRPSAAEFLPYVDRLRDEDAGAAAVQSGHAHLLPWLVQHGCPLDLTDTVVAAVQHCSLEGLQRVWELMGCTSGLPDDDRKDTALYRVLKAAGGLTGATTLAKLSWLLSMAAGEGAAHSRRQRLLEAAAERAAEAGSLPVLQWLYVQGLDLAGEQGIVEEALGEGVLPPVWSGPAPWSKVLAAAIGQGHAEAVWWLVEVAGCPLPHEEQRAELELIWNAAGKGGCVPTISWLLECGLPLCWMAMDAAARAGRLEAVQFLHLECGLGLHSILFEAAAGSHNVELATWLLEVGCPTDHCAYCGAAAAADVDMLWWLVWEAGCPWREHTVCNVIHEWGSRTGSGWELEQAVRMLLEAGFPPGDGGREGTMERAAAWGNLPLLRYLHEECGVEMEHSVLAAAVDSGCVAMVEWLVDVGCPLAGEEAYSMYSMASRNGDVDMLACLRRLGVPIEAGALRKVHGWAPVLRWLLEHGAPWDGEAVEEAVTAAKKYGTWGESAAWLEARMEAGQQGGDAAGAGGSAVAVAKGAEMPGPDCA